MHQQGHERLYRRESPYSRGKKLVAALSDGLDIIEATSNDTDVS